MNEIVTSTKRMDDINHQSFHMNFYFVVIENYHNDDDKDCLACQMCDCKLNWLLCKYISFIYIYIVYWCQPFFSFVLHSGNYKIVISMTRGDARVTFKWSKRIKLKHFPILFKWIFPHIIVCNLKFKIFQLFSFLYSIEFF